MLIMLNRVIDRLRHNTRYPHRTHLPRAIRFPQWFGARDVTTSMYIIIKINNNENSNKDNNDIMRWSILFGAHL